MCIYVEGETYVEVTHGIVGLARLKCTGQAGRLETQGTADVGGLEFVGSVEAQFLLPPQDLCLFS